MSVLDDGDVVYMPASPQSLHAPDTVCHGALGRTVFGLKICSCCLSQKSELKWERQRLGLLLPLPGT